MAVNLSLSLSSRCAIVQNQILRSLVPESFDRLRPYLEPVALKRRAILQEHNRPVEYIHFIEHGVASLFARTHRDGPVEVAVVGRLGFVGVPAVIGTMRSPHRCMMEVAGEAMRIRAREMRRIMEGSCAIRQQLLNYVHLLLIQNMQMALCNVRHGLNERLCRWLLLASDRLDDKFVPLTHEQLSMILGVRRAGITTTLSDLEGAGAVKKSRGAVEIADRAVLECRTCECYRIIAAEYRRLTSSSSYQHLIDLPVIDP